MRKEKNSAKKIFLSICLTLSLCISGITVCQADTEETIQQKQGQEVKEEVFEISDTEDFAEFAQNCRYDSWSIGKTVQLMTDLDLMGLNFEGVAYFNGTFEGNGHTISNLYLDPKGSDYGFFRYIGESGIVKDLKVRGIIKPSGSRSRIGGLAGVNYGTIMDCSFEGSISGDNMVGGIAGVNKETGKIISCDSSGVILATNHTGGIAGKNEGILSECSNHSSVNIEELETTLDLGVVDLGNLNLTENVASRDDMGGIAGNSTGVISSCKNYGTIGFAHTGYNIGGIAGSQSGILLDCENEGDIYGRKDVGGIVGQAEPYIESEYLKDKAEETRNEVTRLNQTLSGISSSISDTSSEARRYTENLMNQYTASFDRISEDIDELSGSVSEDKPEAQGYLNNVQDALNQINEVGNSDERLTDEQIDSIRNQLDVVNDNLSGLSEVYSGTGNSAEELANSISEELKKDDRRTELENLVTTIDNGIQSVADGIDSAVNQLNQITDQINEDLSVIMGEEEYVEDISSMETAEDTDGVISGCINRGAVNGDLNVGGIAGTMNVEYDGDPEFDLDLTESVNVTLRSTVNDVIVHSVNYGKINAKKNCAGGIVGLQELGFLSDCEGYGYVKSDAGNYLGGIVGKSAGTIRNSYSLCSISGTDYVGGICGNGYTVTDSISICEMESDGERIGSVAGFLEEEGTVRGNYFVKSKYDGIDNISYAGAAEPVSYETVMGLENIPEGLKAVKVSFETEDEVIEEKMVAYGGSISADEFPEVEEKEGFYLEWPDEDELKDIRKNLVVTASYVPWTESLAGEPSSEDGRTLFLAVGDFYRESGLEMEECSGPDGLAADAVVEYAYRWEITGQREKEYESVEGHFYAPVQKKKTVQLWIQRDGSWVMAEGKEDGSYLTADIPYGAAFAVVTIPKDYAGYYEIAAVAVVLLVLVLLLVKGIKRRKKRAENKKRQKEGSRD